MVEIINILLNIINLVKVKEFRQRFISTIVLLTLLLLLFLIGNPYLSIFFACLFSLIFFEFEKLISAFIGKFQLLKVLLIQVSLLSLIFLDLLEIEIFPIFIDNYKFLLLMSLLINFVFLSFNKTTIISFILSNLIILSFFSLINILQQSNGLYIILFIVILISTMDTFAYVGGKIFGKNSIVPKISKGKTIEGTLVGFCFTIIVSIIARDLINLSIIGSIICGIIISALSFLGDLLESYFKRNIGVKDSGKLIPGHGGLMDRFDGYFLVLPVSHIFFI